VITDTNIYPPEDALPFRPAHNKNAARAGLVLRQNALPEAAAICQLGILELVSANTLLGLNIYKNNYCQKINFMTAKKIFIIAAVLLVLASITLIVYNFFIKSPSSTTTTNNNGTLPSQQGSQATPTGHQTAGNGQTNLKIMPISQEKAYSPAIGTDGDTVKYFSLTNGQVLTSAFDGSNLRVISSTTLNNQIKALWSPDKDKIVGIFSENGKIKKYFYNYATNQSSLLNESIGYIAWSPDSKKIAYQFTSSGSEQSTISVANPDGTNWKNIFKTRLDGLIVEWPAKDKISLRTKVSGLAQGLLYALNPDTGDFSKILSDLSGLSVAWSPKADKILYSVTNSIGKKPSLWLADESGSNSKDLKLAGLADKCVWSKDDRTIFCALPQQFSEYATWPDDYYKGLVILSDDTKVRDELLNA